MESHQQQPHLGLQTPSFTFNPNNKFSKDVNVRPYSNVAMNEGMHKSTDSGGMGAWATPTSFSRPRPTTIHETGFSYCMPQEYTSLPAWDSSTMRMIPINHGVMQTYAVPQDLYSGPANHGLMIKPPYDDGMELVNDTDMTIGQALTTDENVPILDLRFSATGLDTDNLGIEAPYNPRRISGSSFTMSTCGGLSEMSSYEDFAATISEAHSFTSDFPPPSNRTSLMSSTQLSPVASPRMTPQGRSDLVRTQSRGRASPSPRPSMRSAPYSVESSRNKRWSTGSYATNPIRRPSPFVYHSNFDSFVEHPPRVSSRSSSPTIPNSQLPFHMPNFRTQSQHPLLMSNHNNFHRNSMLLPTSAYHEPRHFETPPPLLSHSLFRMLQSNADPHSLHSHYGDLSDPPELYASLQEEQVPPPDEDINPSDSEIVPHEQELRFDGDLYTPKWVRGHGNKREGWCGICKPGRWLVLKNSAFWYDKSFTHGISAATGNPFQEPQETRRMDGNPDVWEGLCGSCNEWVALVSSKKKGTTWFRHAYKCHTHPKIKDAPKRRRESSHTRALAASSIAKPKVETVTAKIEIPMTPQMTPNSSLSTTPTPGQPMRATKTISALESLSTMI